MSTESSEINVTFITHSGVLYKFFSLSPENEKYTPLPLIETLMFVRHTEA